MMPFELVIQRPATDPENIGSEFLIATDPSQGHTNDFFFNRFQSRPQGERADRVATVLTASNRITNSLWNKVRCEFLAIHHENRRLNEVFELANISWPRIVPEQPVGFTGDALDVFAVHAGKMGKKMIGEHRDGSRTLSQRRHADMKNIETVEKVLTEMFFRYAFYPDLRLSQR